MKLKELIFLATILSLTGCADGPTESAAEFVGRIDKEGTELSKELDAAFGFAIPISPQIPRYWQPRRANAVLNLKVKWSIRLSSIKVLRWTA